MRTYLVRMVTARQDIPRGELVMRLICLASAAVGVLVYAVSPWRLLDAVGTTIGLAGVLALTVTIMRWGRREEGSWRAVLWRSRAARRAVAERAAGLRLPEDQGGQH